MLFCAGNIRCSAILLLAAAAAQADSSTDQLPGPATGSELVADADSSGDQIQGALPAASADADGLQHVRLELDSRRVRWRVMQLQAKKFLLSASTLAQLSIVDSAMVRSKIIPPSKGDPVMPGSRVVNLRSSTRFFGRESRLQVLMAPDNAQAYQYMRDSSGDRAKHRVYRYTDTGIYVRTHRPADKTERDQRWESWSDISINWRPFSPAAHGAAILEPLGILYAASAADLRPGQEPLEFLSVSDKKVAHVRLSAQPAMPREVDFQLTGPDGTVRCRGSVPAIRLELEGEPVDSSAAEEFEFLGLQDDINIYVEPVSRLVLEVSGKAPIVGDLVIRLQRATLTVADGCPVL